DTQQFLCDADVNANTNSDGSINESSKYSQQSISVTNQGNTIVGVALGLGIKTGDGGTPSGAGAVAVNINNVENTFAAAIENKANIIAGPSVTTTGSDGKTSTTPAVQVNALSDTKIVGVAAGVAANVSGGNNVNIGAAGSAVKQSIKNNTTATVADSAINTDNLSLDAETTSTLVSVAGQVSIATGENSIAAGLTWAENHLDNTTGVYARGITLSGINSGASTNLIMDAENKSKTWAVAAGGSVSTGRAAAEGAYASNNGTNDTEAIVDKYETKNEQGAITYTRNSTINNAKNISVTAKDNTVEKGIAGSIAVAAGKDTVASIGGAVVYNNIGNSDTDKQTVKAQVHNAAITTVSGATIQVKAINDADFLGLALGGAVRASTEGTSPIGISAQGSVAVSTAYMDTIAGMENVKIDETSGSQSSKVEVEANSTSDITSSTDALSVSAGKGGVQIAVGAAVSKVNSDADTKTEIKNSTMKAQDVIAKANSTNKILDVAIGVGVSAGAGPAAASVAGNVAVNKIDNDTTVTFDNDNIYATGTVAALSDSYEQLRNYGGGISVAATSGQAAVAFGATIVTNTIEGDTKSVVKNSYITALGAGDGVKLNEHSFGAITGSDPNYELKEKAAAAAAAKKGLVVNAEAEHLLRDVSITGGVAVSSQAGVAVDATVVINKIAGTTSAEVNSTDVNKD
ncbi:MAG: beta strand repeat-containing protein, partial [Phascolarctobacterium sp.]